MDDKAWTQILPTSIVTIAWLSMLWLFPVQTVQDVMAIWNAKATICCGLITALKELKVLTVKAQDTGGLQLHYPMAVSHNIDVSNM